MPEIDGWAPYLGETRRLILSCDGDLASALDAVASGLAGAGFKVKDRRPEGFTASWLDTWELVPPDIEFKRTRLGVSAVAGGAAAGRAGEVQVGIQVEAGTMHRRGSSRAGKGLSAALRTLEDQGRRITVTDWEPVGG